MNFKCIIIIIICIKVIATPSKTVTFLGDSLTAGHQLYESEAFPKQLESLVGTQNMISINRGVSGDTSYTLLNRLKFSLNPTPDIVFLSIGANDGLRGMPIYNTKQNISTIISTLKQKNIKVILTGMSLPENYSESYIEQFEQIYPSLASEHKIPLMPFLLKDVAGSPTLNLSDGIHPNKDGHSVIAKNILKFLTKEELVSTKNEWQAINFE